MALQDHKNYSDEDMEKFIARKLGYFSPLTNVIKKRMDHFHPAYFEFSEIFDNYVDRFDMFVITDCKHMTDKYKNQYTEVLRDVQTISATIFFICVHVPLSRHHSAWCLVTGLLPMMLSIKAKFWFYEKMNDIVVLMFPNDQEAKNNL